MTNSVNLYIIVENEGVLQIKQDAFSILLRYYPEDIIGRDCLKCSAEGDSENSQAKGPVMDGTLESCVDTAPKKQFLSRGMRNIEADLLGENLSGF